MYLSNRRTVIKSLIFATLASLGIVLYLYKPNYRLSDLKDAALSIVPTKFAPKNKGIPQKLWYKLGPKGISHESQEWISDCILKNPTYEATFMTDESGEDYVKEKWADHTDIVETYLALPFPILKADMLRYMLLYTEGGVWNDLDVSCENIPINEWIPEVYKHNTSIVVGWEFDMGWGGFGAFTREFASWTIMSVAKSPHMLTVITDIVDAMHELEMAHNVPMRDLKLDQIGDVVDLTGPRRLTRGILKSLQLSLGRQIAEEEIGELWEPKLIGDVLIFPGYSFAEELNKYDADPERKGPALITHHFAGSWKNDKGGETLDKRYKPN